MLPRNQNKPPPTTVVRSPGNKKENLEEMPLDKRRKLGVGKTLSGLRAARQALTAVNSDASTVCGSGSDAGSVVAGGIEFSSREDVERLLNEKMKGKGKTDYKGKSEQMMEYIKRLRACIKWLEDREDEHIDEEDKLREVIEAEEVKYTEMEEMMRAREKELNLTLEELMRNHASLKEKLIKEELDRMAVAESYDNEKEAREAAERSRDALSVELSKSQQEAVIADKQIKSLQDINKRLQDYNTSLLQFNNRLQSDAAANNEAITRLQKEKTAMMESLSSLRSHSASLQEQLTSLRASQQEAAKEKDDLKNTLECTRNELQNVREDRSIQLSLVQSLSSELDRYKQSSAKSVIELGDLTRKTNMLELTCSSQKDQIHILENQLNTANGKLQMADSATLRTRTEYEEQKQLVEDLQRRLADSELKIVDLEKLRKKLHNTILELKGNIRVFCRVRPLLSDREGNGLETTSVSYPALLESQGRGIDLLHNGKKHNFTFDKVFDHAASQEDVFVEISQLVQSALDGYKVCIFAYGQTGSGKTYTMMGKQEAIELKGLIPRSLEQIFETSQALSSQGWTYKMQASMLEIYNESIRDLLGSSRSSGPDPNATAGKQYTIKHDQNGNTHVSDLTVVDVCSIKEVSYLLQQAANSRSVGRTQMNEQSSRSHFVFILRIYGDNESTDQHVQGVLNLIDLAGSERLDKSGSTGDRLKETQHINKSLLSLSDVISSIAKKEDHIPFRNSKLTYLLQPCLGGESKTLMFVNISPEASSTGESKCSLQFASKVNSCEIGVPRRQTQLRPAGC